MNAYSIALFFHVVGALGFFVALGLEWTTVMQLRRATTAEQVREWLNASSGLRRVGMISMIALLVAGIYMMATVWGGAAWIVVTFATIILLMILAMRVSAPRMSAIRQAVRAENGSLSPQLQQLLHHGLLQIGIQSRIIIALGVVFLMTVKPDLLGSLLTIGIAIVLGLASALSLLNRDRAPVSTMRKTS